MELYLRMQAILLSGDFTVCMRCELSRLAGGLGLDWRGCVDLSDVDVVQHNNTVLPTTAPPALQCDEDIFLSRLTNMILDLSSVHGQPVFMPFLAVAIRWLGKLITFLTSLFIPCSAKLKTFTSPM